jgi:hypothetical protein
MDARTERSSDAGREVITAAIGVARAHLRGTTRYYERRRLRAGEAARAHLGIHCGCNRSHSLGCVPYEPIRYATGAAQRDILFQGIIGDAAKFTPK